MRESIHVLRCAFLCLQDTQSKWTRSRYASVISTLACSLGLTLEHSSFNEITFFKSSQCSTTRHYCSLADFLCMVAQNVVTDRQTRHLRTMYCNPSCACTLRLRTLPTITLSGEYRGENGARLICVRQGSGVLLFTNSYCQFTKFHCYRNQHEELVN